MIPERFIRIDTVCTNRISMLSRVIAVLISFLCLLALFSVLPNGCSEITFIVKTEPMLESWTTNGYHSQPYVGFYMATDYVPNFEEVHAKAVRVTASFSGTNMSVIQNDNFLFAGIAVQGPDSVHGGCNAIDWGYTYGLVLSPRMHSAPFISIEIFEGHEWVNCLPGNAEFVYGGNIILPDITIDSYITLTMNWTQSTLDFYATVCGVTYLVDSYTPNATASHYFHAGVVGRKWGLIPLPNTVKLLQFPGAWSAYNIGRTGWASFLSNPRYIAEGSSLWSNISYAYSTDGPNSYWDNTLGWGGATYGNVTASYGRDAVCFFPTSYGATLPADTLLWDCSPQSGGCPTLSVWNGSEYVLECILNIHGSSDVTIQRMIQNGLVPQNNICKLQISELDNFTSYIDQVKLYAVGDDGVWRICPLVYANHSTLGKITNQLLLDDEIRIELKPSQITSLNFFSLISHEETRYIFEINGHNPKEAW